MATSGSFQTTLYNGKKGLEFQWSLSSQSEANNTSTISWQLVGCGSGSAYHTSAPFKITIDGTQIFYSNTRIRLSVGTVVGSGSYTLTHNSYGDKSFTVNVQGAIYEAVYNVSGSKTFDLPNIPKKGELTSVTSFISTENPSVTYKNPLGSRVTLNICISKDGNYADLAPYRTISATGTSYTFNLTDQEKANLLTYCNDAQSKPVKFILRTTNNGTNYFSTINTTYYVEKSVSPINTIPQINNITYTEQNPVVASVMQGVNKYVKFLSNIYCRMTTVAGAYSTIDYNKISCGDQVVESNEARFNSIESDTIYFYTKDKRGFSNTDEITLNMVPYIKLTCDLDVTVPTTDGESTLTISGNCYSGELKNNLDNSIIVWYRYKAGSGNYCDWVPIANEDVEQFEGGYETYVDVTGLDYTKAYTFQAKVGDCFVEVESATVKVKTVPVFDWSDEDFNFNVPVTMTEPMKVGGVTQDYIVKDGKSGAFTYRKWNSGKLEVYATKSQSTGSFNASGAIYVNANTLSIGNYPVAFVETPVTVATCYGVSGWLLQRDGGTATSAPTFAVVRTFVGSSGTVTINLYAVGKWK